MKIVKYFYVTLYTPLFLKPVDWACHFFFAHKKADLNAEPYILLIWKLKLMRLMWQNLVRSTFEVVNWEQILF